MITNSIAGGLCRELSVPYNIYYLLNLKFFLNALAFVFQIPDNLINKKYKTINVARS